jgi:16S rRNA (cytosine1402-N4)-methyltransferase
MTNNEFTHIPVLSKEVIDGLNLKPDGHYLDATLGGGGHTKLILDFSAHTRVTALERDGTAIAFTKEYLKLYQNRLHIWQGNFAEYNPQNTTYDGIIADLGVSSPQFDTNERGFSFRHRGKLDMRMDQNQSLDAAKIINHWSEKQLAEIFYLYGEERFSRRIAKKIVQKRPLQTTTQLADVIASVIPSKYRYGKIHPATRVFQALRIAVNQELESLEKFLHQAPSWLKSEGRIAVISFHSLEDRIVKHLFRDHPLLDIITKKPITPQLEEKKYNPRSRSAKLRIAKRIES